MKSRYGRMPLTEEEERLFRKLMRKRAREYMKERRDKVCHKCKTPLKETDNVCPKCGTRKRKYSPRTTRKDKDEKKTTKSKTRRNEE